MSNRTVLAGTAVLTFLTTGVALAATGPVWPLAALLFGGAAVFFVVFVWSIRADALEKREIKARKQNLITFLDDWSVTYERATRTLRVTMRALMFYSDQAVGHRCDVRIGGRTVAVEPAGRFFPQRSLWVLEYLARDIDLPSEQTATITLTFGDSLDPDIQSVATREVPIAIEP